MRGRGGARPPPKYFGLERPWRSEISAALYGPILLEIDFTFLCSEVDETAMLL